MYHYKANKYGCNNYKWENWKMSAKSSVINSICSNTTEYKIVDQDASLCQHQLNI